MADGGYRLGPLAVDVVDGVARVAGTDTIAGSTATMDRQFRFAVDHSGLAPRRGADGWRAPGVDQSGPGVGPAMRRSRCPERAPTWWCWTQTCGVTGVLRRGSWLVEPDTAQSR